MYRQWNRQPSTAFLTNSRGCGLRSLSQPLAAPWFHAATNPHMWTRTTRFHGDLSILQHKQSKRPSLTEIISEGRESCQKLSSQPSFSLLNASVTFCNVSFSSMHLILLHCYFRTSIVDIAGFRTH